MNSGYKSVKLQTNLRLCVSRFELLTKKKTEQSQRARREISDLLKTGRYERARIKVEHVIREDYIIEAMEIIQQYCDLLLARMGLLETMAYCDEGLLECVNTVIWVTPRLQHDVAEMVEVEKQLGKKFGKAFLEQAHGNKTNIVNEKVVLRMGVVPPSPVLIERYLEEIGRNFGIVYKPDAHVLLADSVPEPLSDKFVKNLESEATSFPPSEGATEKLGAMRLDQHTAPVPGPVTHKATEDDEDPELDDLLDRFNALKKK